MASDKSLRRAREIVDENKRRGNGRLEEVIANALDEEGRHRMPTVWKGWGRNGEVAGRYRRMRSRLVIVTILVLAAIFFVLREGEPRPPLVVLEATETPAPLQVPGGRWEWCGWFEVTAFHDGAPRHSSGARTGAVLKVIAADENIPFGTILYVEGYGAGTVLDRGGAIEEARLDVIMSSEGAAWEWGRRTVQVWEWRDE